MGYVGKFFENWELCRKLGSGAFGEVHHWRNRKEKLEIATKSLKQNKTLGVDEEYKLKKRWQQEYDFSINIDTEYIVRGLKLRDTKFLRYLNEQHAWKPLPVLIMEYCNGGDLRAHMQKIDNINGLKEYEVREILRTLRHAIDYMHNQCNINHRDLKPDNIVIHKLSNGKRIYKLTDFGFARFINDRTMLQSVVGTRNYFAPEVIDTSEYTNTVDYWSAGVIAFEIICGTLPFIPHQIQFNIINAVKFKPKNCIAITENFSQKDSFENHERIFEENHISSIFREKVEYWLRLALDSNFRTRGTALVETTGISNLPGTHINIFYKTIDDLLDTRVLTVFSLNTYSFHEFEIHENTGLVPFTNNLTKATGIPENHLFYIAPTGHHLKRSYDAKKPYDFYMDKWHDTNDHSNPPVMLFLVNINNEEESFQPKEPKISDAVKHYCCLPKNEDLPLWSLLRTIYDIHYLLTNEQRHLATMLFGIKEYAMNIEDEILNDISDVENLQFYGHYVKGRILQYKTVINGMFHHLPYKTDEILSYSPNENLETTIDKTLVAIISLNKRLKSAQLHMKEEANSHLFEELTKKDVYNIENFRHHLLEKHQGSKYELLRTPVNKCMDCYDTVYKFLEKRDKILKDILRKSLRKVENIHKEYRTIKNAVQNSFNLLKKMETDIQNFTDRLNGEFNNAMTNRAQQHNSMLIVPDGSNGPSLSSQVMCGNFDLMKEQQQISTIDLINEATENMQRMAMDIDEMPNGFSDISVTENSNDFHPV